MLTGFMGRFANRGAEPRRSSGTFDTARTEVDDKRTERFQALLRQAGRSRVGLLNLALSAEGAAIAKLENQMWSRWSLRKVLIRANNDTPRRVADHPDTPLNRIIECGDFKIDLTRRTVAMRGRVLDLTSEEFDVFVFLAGHPQSLITPRTMLSTSWTAHRVRQTEFLRALVSLRNKLDAADPGKRYLRTEPWVIYRFDPTSLATT